VAQMMGVSTATAHRAMQVLAKRRMLVRRRNRGTFIGPHFEVGRGTLVRTVHAIMEAPGLDRNEIPLDGLVRGIRSRLKDVNVQITFLPQGDPQAFVQELLGSAAAVGSVVGFLPVSCPREVYRRLFDSGVPTVVLGTPYIDQRDIPSIDVDNRTAGRLLAEFLIGGGHSRMVVLMATEGQPGTNCFFDGVSDALTKAELPHNALIVRHVPVEPAAVAAQLRELLAMPEPPTALIARTPQMVRAVSAAFDSLGIAPAKRCEIVYQNHPATENGAPSFVCAQPAVSMNEIVARAAEMLDRIGRGESLDETRVVVPVELCRK
jgi:DNA-binding LacI/PurR family transcriptional regulator